MGQWVGLAAKCSVEFSLSTLGPVGWLGSDFFDQIVAKYVGAVDGFGSGFLCGVFAEYFGASGKAWKRNVRWSFR